MDRKIKDTLVGVFIIIGVILFIALYTWLTGRIGMRNTRNIAVYFSDVGGLRVGDPVMVYGLEKGSIKSLQIDGDSVLVIVAVRREIPVPEDSRFAIRSVGMLGGDRFIKITPGKSDRQGTVFHGISESIDMESIAAELGRVVTIIENMKLPDLDNIGPQLSAAIDRTVNNLSQMFQAPGSRLESLTKRLDSLSILLQGDGSLGRMIKSDELYQELRSTNKSIRDLMEDIKANPKKYLDLKDLKVKVF